MTNRALAPLVLLLLVYSFPAGTAETIQVLPWNTPLPQHPGITIRQQPSEGGSTLVITSKTPMASTIPLATWETAGRIGPPAYALRGTASCTEVKGQAYLEMWSELSDGKRFFSRTLAHDGPMAAFSGTCPERETVLPAFLTPGAPAPTRLEVNLILPASGTITLSPLTLVQYSEGESPFTPTGAWWSARTCGLIGGIGGAVAGLIGALSGFLALREHTRGAALALLLVVGATGVVVLMAGVIAMTAYAQPPAVYGVLLLLGGIVSLVFLFNGFALKRRAADLNAKRDMQ